ncbi:MAG: zinc-binding dehydrogenase [Planctomycetes bacterium]|nr:zinc-binding dehydrogenase [Planctomycetota bacterium]
METVAVAFTGKEQLELRRVQVPEPAAGQVLVENQKTLISTGTECICYQRKFAPGSHYDNWVKYPFFSGYSAAGRVLKVGEGVTQFRPGDRVASGSGHQRLTVQPASGVVPIPDGVSDEDATWATLSFITQHGFRKPQLVLGESVVVVGAGLLGQLITQYARLSGAGEVIVIDPAVKRLEMAKAHGATHALGVGIEKAYDAVIAITGPRRAQVLYEMTGHPAVFAHALALLGKHGRLALIGDTGTPAEQHLTFDIIGRDLRIFGAHATNPPPEATDDTPWSRRAMIQAFFKFLTRGQMKVSDLVTHRFDYSKAADAFALLSHRRDEAMGVILDFTTAG